jgi:hypothetical protein
MVPPCFHFPAGKFKVIAQTADALRPEEKRQMPRITGEEAADIAFKAVYASVRFVGRLRGCY